MSMLQALGNLKGQRLSKPRIASIKPSTTTASAGPKSGRLEVAISAKKRWYDMIDRSNSFLTDDRMKSTVCNCRQTALLASDQVQWLHCTQQALCQDKRCIDRSSAKHIAGTCVDREPWSTKGASPCECPLEAGDRSFSLASWSQNRVNSMKHCNCVISG